MAARKQKPTKPTKEPKSTGARILVIEARFYDDIADALLAGAAKVLDEAKATWDIITVPGSLEIVPAIAIAVEAAERQKKPYDGVVALGCVIQGETYHFDIVSMQSARALIDYSVAHRLALRQWHSHRRHRGAGLGARPHHRAGQGRRRGARGAGADRDQTATRQEIGHGQSGTIERGTPRQPPRRSASGCRSGALPDGSGGHAAQRGRWRSSRATGSAARSRATNTCRRRPPFSATWFAALSTSSVSRSADRPGAAEGLAAEAYRDRVARDPARRRL